MLEVFAEPKECVEDVAMAQWEEASVITVRGNVKSAGKCSHRYSKEHCTPKPHNVN